MKQVQSLDMFSACSDGDILCVTTNGIVTKDGKLVMGAGIAKTFRDSFPGCDERLGKLVSNNGNHVYYIGQAMIGSRSVHLVSFPTKNDWKDKSSTNLIENSCVELRALVQNMCHYRKVFLPLPGCGLGGLDWNKDVSPIFEKYLPEECYVVCQQDRPRTLSFIPNAQLLPLKEPMSQPTENPSNLDILFSKIARIEDFSDKIGELVFDEINKDDNLTTEMGSYILHTLRSCQTDRELEIANDMLTAVCGWGVETLIKKIQKLDEEQHVWESIAP